MLAVEFKETAQSLSSSFKQQPSRSYIFTVVVAIYAVAGVSSLLRLSLRERVGFDKNSEIREISEISYFWLPRLGGAE